MDQDSLNDLQYNWPPNILHYETKIMLGLTFTELIVVAGVGLGLAMINIVLGLAAAVLTFFLTRKYWGLGNRRLHEYLLVRLRHRLVPRTVKLALILPPDHQERVVITDLDDREVVRVGEDL